MPDTEPIKITLQQNMEEIARISDEMREQVIRDMMIPSPLMEALVVRRASLESGRSFIRERTAEAMLGLQQKFNDMVSAVAYSRKAFVDFGVSFRGVRKRIPKGWRRYVRRMKATGMDPGPSPRAKTYERESRRAVAKQAKITAKELERKAWLQFTGEADFF